MNLPPAALEPLRPLSREILQGYFLTLSNLENRPVVLQILFTVITTAAEDMFDSGTVTSFFDADGSNQIVTVTSPTPETRSIILTLPPKDTGLLLVQPNPSLLLQKLDKSEIEIRGYVEIKQLQSCGEGSQVAKILVTPDQRGTFYQLEVPKREDGTFDREAELSLVEQQMLDQIAYSLPTGTGGCLFELS
ncbi:MAG: hypothetical protein AAFV71_20710 [Cyanobacteria bacterium J06633_8]